MAKWTKVGSVRKAKSGKGSYVLFDTELTIKKGEMLQLIDPRKSIEEGVASGKFDEKTAAEKRKQLEGKEWLTREVYLVKD